MNKKMLGTAAVLVVLGSGFIAGCGSNSNSGSSSNSTSSSNQNVTLTFLQNKTEAVGEFNKLIAAFEKQNPNITVKQVNPPNADTVLQADMTKNQMPDVIAMGADATYVEMAQNGMLKDFSGSPLLNNVNSKYVQITENETGSTTPNGIPYTVNAQTILYNKDLLQKYGVSVPTTWNQLIAAAQKIKAAGGQPFEFGFKDSWTTMVPWNSLAANLAGASFNSDLKAGKTTFAKSYATVAQDIQELASFGQKNEYGTGYNDANTAFANGKSVFYVQGDWAISSILAANPKANIGSFAFPATNDASTNKLVSGVDSILTESASTSNGAAADKFIAFLLDKTQAQAYANAEELFSAVNGVTQKDPIVSNLSSYINSGNIVDYPDHYYPTALDANVSNLIQGFLVNKQSPSAFLTNLDSQYKKAVAHQ